jgi:hypothetical protein
MRLVNVPSWSMTFAVAAKCGSSSLYDALEREFNVDDITLSDEVRVWKDRTLIPKTDTVVCVVRDPVARFISLWCNKARNKGRLIGHGTDLHDLSVDQLLAYIGTHDNHHWAPQVELYANLGEVTYVALEDFGDYWSEHTPATTTLGVCNTTHTRPVLSLEQIAELYAMYSADIDLLKQVELLDANGRV